jgi:hypothetical protein
MTRQVSGPTARTGPVRLWPAGVMAKEAGLEVVMAIPFVEGRSMAPSDRHRW